VRALITSSACVAAALILASCVTEPPAATVLYRSDAFELRADAVVQGPFDARAHSAETISSSYPRAAHEVMFKFSINGAENEFPPGKDQMIYLRGQQGQLETPVYTFGVLHGSETPLPVPGAPSEEGPLAVTFRVDMNAVLQAFDARGEYTPPNGTVIKAEDFHGVYIMGNTVPLSWEMSSLRPGSPRQLQDPDGDGIYELTLVFNAAYNRPLDSDGRAVWTLGEDLSALPKYRSDQLLIDAIHNLSLEELLQLVRDDGGIVAGARWPNVWTRDIAWGALLAAAAILPETVQKSLLLKVDEEGRIVQDLGTGGSWPVSTDRVAWAVAAWEVYAVTGDRDWLRSAFDIIRRSAEADLETAFDDETGLFYGESSFLDWREQSYPRWMQPADIYRSQALGTNALHYAAYRILAKMANTLGEDSGPYTRRADTVRAGMNRYLWQPDRGYYGQFRYGRNYPSLSPRAEALGEAFAVLFGVATPDRRTRLAASMPVVSFGIPSFWPYSADVPAYHNAGIWPQVGGFWTWAAAEAGNTAAVEHGLASLYRPAALFVTNKENMVAATGHFEGTELNSDRFLGSVGASLAGIYRVLLGMRFHENGLEFRPSIPRAYAGQRQLSGFTYRNAVLTVDIEGFGNRVAEAYLNGERLASATVPDDLSGAQHVLLIMNGEWPDTRLNLVRNVDAPATPNPRLEDTRLSWPAVAGAAYYRLYRNGEPVERVAGTQTQVEISDRLGEYQLAAIDASGSTSFLSDPLRVVAQAGVAVLSPDGVADRPEPDSWVLLTPKQNTAVTFSFEVPATACYSVDALYVNGSGPINSGNSAAIRSLLHNENRVGPLVMPHRGKNNWEAWGYSHSLRVVLEQGEHVFTLAYTDDDRNMSIDVNDVRLKHLRVTRLAADASCREARTE